MSEEFEDEGDVSKFDPFKGYNTVITFFNNIDKFSTLYDIGDAESGPSLGVDLTTAGLKRAIKATCESALLSPRDLLNLLRRATNKTTIWPPEERGLQTSLRSLLHWISECVQSLERSDLRQELSLYEAEEEEDDFGDVSHFEAPKVRKEEVLEIWFKLSSRSKRLLLDPAPNGIVAADAQDSIDTKIRKLVAQYGRNWKDIEMALIDRYNRMYESTEDEGDVSSFPKPKTNPIIAHCGMCGSPIGANGPVIDIPADYDPDDYPRDDICDSCRSQEERHYITHEMALDAGDPDLEGQLW